ncbi:MAG: hypothetical protein KME45_30620 [Stenomitos rutilans HA7619-LM2]|nr:hypothetical protein [Stenomitos rutilans HA7619-LM2]
MENKKEPRSQIEIITCNGKVEPMFLFQEYSFLDEELKTEVFRYCVERGCVPLIDYEEEVGSWIFHSLSCGDRIWKKPIAEKFKNSVDKTGEEAKLEQEFVQHLKQQGIDTQTQVPCLAGIADIVTPEIIYEVKHILSRSTLFHAIGQVLLYRQCINSTAQAVIVCRRSTVSHLHALAESAGIAVIEWR